MRLHQVAHSRAGDKGDISNLSLIVYDLRHFEAVRAHVTEARVRQHFEGVVHGEVKRYEIPHLGILNFVMAGALGGGVTCSLALDPHGKSLSAALLVMEVPEIDEAIQRLI